MESKFFVLPKVLQGTCGSAFLPRQWVGPPATAVLGTAALDDQALRYALRGMILSRFAPRLAPLESLPSVVKTAGVKLDALYPADSLGAGMREDLAVFTVNHPSDLVQSALEDLAEALPDGDLLGIEFLIGGEKLLPGMGAEMALRGEKIPERDAGMCLAVESRPGDRQGDWGSLADARGVRRHGGGSALVAEVVEIDLSGS